MDNVIEILKKVGAIITDDHFVYTSGKHGDIYINKDALYPHTEETSQVCHMMAEKVKDLDIEVVAGPSVGGIILSQWTAYHLSALRGDEILGVYAEKDSDGTQIFRRGYDKMLNDKNVLAVEDLTTTGGSIKKVVDKVREHGGRVVAVCLMVNRNPKLVKSDVVGAPLFSLCEMQANAWNPDKCPLCKQQVPINTTVGHGKKFLESR